MALSISTSNVLINYTPTLTDAGTGEVPSNISDPDHSLTYTSGSGSGYFEVNYHAQTGISYVGISGHNAATSGPVVVQIIDGDGVGLIDSVTIKRNHNLMFTFPTMNFTKLLVRFLTTSTTFQTTLSFIAAGQHLTISSGEQAGYKRAWLNRSKTQKTTTNLTVAPIASTVKAKSLKGLLSFPNEAALFTEGDWQDFIDFSFEQPFFIKEQVTKPESSYLCFDPNHDIPAHSQTRELNGIMLKFTAYNGL
jgi:hypothetical protein